MHFFILLFLSLCFFSFGSETETPKIGLTPCTHYQAPFGPDINAKFIKVIFPKEDTPGQTYLIFELESPLFHKGNTLHNVGIWIAAYSMVRATPVYEIYAISEEKGKIGSWTPASGRIQWPGTSAANQGNLDLWTISKKD